MPVFNYNSIPMPPQFIEVTSSSMKKPMLIKIDEILYVKNTTQSDLSYKSVIGLLSKTELTVLESYEEVKKLLGWYPPEIGAKTLAKGI